MSHRLFAVRLLQFAIAALLIADIGWFTFAVFRPAWTGYLLSVLGRNPDCPAAEAARGILRHVNGNQAEVRMRNQQLLRKEGGLELWRTPRGNWWLPSGTGVSMNLAVLLAQQEVDVYGAAPRGPRQGDTVLDCGAHVGVFVRKALRRGAATVVAIEPNPANVECLRRNFPTEIQAGRVIVYAKGVWDKEDRLLFHESTENTAGGSFLLVPERGDRTIPGIPVTTIDKLVAELKLSRVDFIKTDIKGATTRALRGAGGTIARFKPALAISTEEFNFDHPAEISAIVRNIWSGYHQECGICEVVEFRVRPEVLYFWP